MAATEHVKKFVFCSENSCGNTDEKVEIYIPELLQPGYSFYTWPSAPILAWFLWQRRHSLVNKTVLELGSGTSLPGILAAKCGAQVYLTDSSIFPKTLQHIHNCCTLNKLTPGEDITILGLTWGLLLNNLFSLPELHYIIASDCFYDPVVFEDILVTVSFLLENNRSAKFLFTYQERSTDWTIEALLRKWNLVCRNVNFESIETASGINLADLMNGHTIHLLEISYKN